VLTNFATSEPAASGIGAFGVNWQSLIFQFITFLMVIWVLNRFVLKKLFKVIDDRREEINAGLERSEKARVELEQAAINADKILAKARTQADEVLSDAHGEAAQLLRTVEQKAGDKAERIVAEAREQLKIDTENAREQLKRDTAKLVTSVASTILEEKLDSKKDQELILESIKKVK
jgi:F-type H+-transporting ATPase subunit b